MKIVRALLLLLLSFGARAAIEDNSFLLIEAYTQGKDEIQLIQHYDSPMGGDYLYDITAELPLVPDKHQLNLNLTDGDEQDFKLGYAYQMNPKALQNITLIASSGISFTQVLSFKLNEDFMNHWNVGLTFREDTTLSLGTSLVYLLHDRFNLLTEVLLETDKETSIILNPGVRSSFKAKWKDSEIVPGIAFPMEIKKDPVGFGVFVYLSIESHFI